MKSINLLNTMKNVEIAKTTLNNTGIIKNNNNKVQNN